MEDEHISNEEEERHDIISHKLSVAVNRINMRIAEPQAAGWIRCFRFHWLTVVFGCGFSFSTCQTEYITWSVSSSLSQSLVSCSFNRFIVFSRLCCTSPPMRTSRSARQVE